MLGKIADGQVGAGSGWVSVGERDDLLPSRRGKLEFPFRRDALEHSSGKVTDEDREIPSVGTNNFLLDCDRQLSAQSCSLIVCRPGPPID